MTWNWQVIISFVLFAMIVTAFTLAIWSYVKTNAIKNSESPSISNFINDNNTYVNNIASAPNVVYLYSEYNYDTNYTLTSTDNGTNFIYRSNIAIPAGSGDNPKLNLIGNKIVNSKGDIIKGYYVTIENVNAPGGQDVEIAGGLGTTEYYVLPPGERVYYVQEVTGISPSVSPSYTVTGFLKRSPPLP
jgi:hypothetical protein